MIMKRFAIWVAALALVGCSQYEDVTDGLVNPSKSQTEFYASMPECDTRTYVEDNKYLRWNAGDEITIFAGNSYNSHWQFAGENGANSGKFNEIEDRGFITGTPLDLTANYAIYPYDENITISEAGVVSLTLPATQVYNHTYANSFGAGANTMMAVTKNTSDNFLSFKNLCGYLKLKFYGEDVTVKSIIIKGNNGEKIAGSATVTMAYGGEPTIVMGDNATNTITIDCGEGIALSSDSANPTIFWVAIPETTFEGGITITVTDTNDQTFEKKTTNVVPIENNLIQPMAALEVECERTMPANNEIWYTNGSTTEPTTPYATNVFGANIVSNTYDTEKECWIIKFDGDVTSIGEKAFYNCKLLTSTTIPESVTSIGSFAFYNCISLNSIEFPKGIVSIEGFAFYNCTSLTGGIIIPDGVTSICVGAFQNCTSLTSVTIPDSVTEIQQYAFQNNKSMTSVTIGRGVVSIGREAFGWCAGELIIHSNIPNPSMGSYGAFRGSYFTKVTIEEGVTSIGNYAFYGCGKLLDVSIPDSVTSIGNNAFGCCISLINITIPQNVSKIDYYAFMDCSSLNDVYCKPTTPPTGEGGMFYNNASGRKIFVPTASVEAYKVAQYWRNYADDIEGYDF